MGSSETDQSNHLNHNSQVSNAAQMHPTYHKARENHPKSYHFTLLLFPHRNSSFLGILGSRCVCLCVSVCGCCQCTGQCGSLSPLSFKRLTKGSVPWRRARKRNSKDAIHNPKKLSFECTSQNALKRWPILSACFHGQ